MVTVMLEGIKPPGDRWKAMKAVWDGCAEVGIEPPDEVEEYFGWEPPDPNGVRVEDIEWEEGGDEDTQFIRLKVSDIPKDVEYLKFMVVY